MTIHREIKQSYLHTFLRTLAVSLISIFVPVYMINLGYPIQEAIATVALNYLFFAIAALLSQKIQPKIGTKKLVLAGTMLDILFFIMLAALKTMHWNFIIIGIMGGIGIGVYWQNLLSLFALHSGKKNEGAESGIFLGLQLFGGVVAPLVSAFLIVFINFEFVIWIALALYAGAIIPLFLTVDAKIPSKTKWKKILDWKIIFLFFIRGMGQGVGFVLPVFIFLLTGSYITIGSLVSVLALAGVATSFVSGKMSDKFSKITITKIGFTFIAFGTLALFFAQNEFVWLVYVILYGIGSAIAETGGFSYVCKYGKEMKDPTKAVGLKEMSSCVGRVFSVALFLMLAPNIVFLICFLISLIFIFFVKIKK